MKRAYVILVTTFILIIGFQNCQQKPSSQLSTEFSSGSATSQQMTALSSEQVQKVILNQKETETLVKNGNSFSVQNNAHYSVDYTTGIVVRISDLNTAEQKYCLNSELLSELKSIISSSKVCRYDDTVASKDSVCTMDYKAPYAQITTNRDVIDLRTVATANCSSERFDLCDGASDMLRGWWVNVKRQLGNLGCAQ